MVLLLRLIVAGLILQVITTVTINSALHFMKTGHTMVLAILEQVMEHIQSTKVL